MAPRDPPKKTVQRAIVKSSAAKKPTLNTSTNSILKKRVSICIKTTRQTSLEANNTIAMDSRKRTNTVPATTLKKENKPAPIPGSVMKSTEKSWKRRPMPAHSGVPIPEKMKQMILKRKQLLLNAKQSELV